MPLEGELLYLTFFFYYLLSGVELWNIDDLCDSSSDVWFTHQLRFFLGNMTHTHTLRGRNHSSWARNIGQKWKDIRGAQKPKVTKSSVMFIHFYSLKLVSDELLRIMNSEGLYILFFFSFSFLTNLIRKQLSTATSDLLERDKRPQKYKEELVKSFAKKIKC